MNHGNERKTFGKKEPLREIIKPDVPLMRYQADNIPDFDGNSKQLNRFVNVCESFIKKLCKPRDLINLCVVHTILSK